MRFTQLTGIMPESHDDWFDPVLTEDTPLYVDPFLVFDDASDDIFGVAHDRVTEFFATAKGLVQKANGDSNSPHWRKALRLLTFPEPKEFALGLSMGSPNGAGTAEHYALAMVESLDVITKAVERRLDYVDMFALFVDGLGVDRISDMFCNILKAQFIAYTRQVCARHDVTCGQITVKHADWDGATGRWLDRRLDMPVSPVTGAAVLLTPDRYLQDIPQQVTPDGFWTWAEAARNRELREDLNYDLAESLTRAEKRKRGRGLARRLPAAALDYVDVVADRDRAPYDVAADPDLLVRWYEAGRKAGAETAAAAGALPQPEDADAFCAWVGTLIDRLTHAIENTDLWRALWNDDYSKPRAEKIVQAVAGQVLVAHCEASDIDLSREANIGRGPVDFKFSAGWAKRALLEVKLMSSPKLNRGAEAQLPQYMLSERIACGYYVCVGFTDAEMEPVRLAAVEATCAAYTAASGYQVRARFIDARPKASASRL